jgi:hypothetical protein
MAIFILAKQLQFVKQNDISNTLKAGNMLDSSGN